jgi:predicted NBD/HSP70 family sugar kinase
MAIFTRGVDGSHPEGGHHIVDRQVRFAIGAHGCWEAMAAGPSYCPAGTIRYQRPSESQLIKLSETTLMKIDANMVAEAAKAWDAYALEIMDKTAYYWA